MELGRIYERVVINSSAAAAVHVLRAAVAGQVIRVHDFGMTGAAAGQVLIQSSSGASPTVISQKIGIDADRLSSMGWRPQKEGALAGVVGKNLEILSTGTTITGYALISLSTD